METLANYIGAAVAVVLLFVATTLFACYTIMLWGGGRVTATPHRKEGTMKTRFKWLALVLAVTACEAGPTGPQGPAGPQGEAGPAGPVGPGIVSFVYEAAITEAVITTPIIQTGATPAAVCYIGRDGVWQLIAANFAQGNTCAVIEDGTGYRGAALVDASLVGIGWRVRIIVFWAA